MKVLKFGGTSVGTVESLRNVKSIIEAIPGKAIIVVSALGGLTDKLIATAGKAAQGDNEWEKDFEAIEERHFHIIDALVPSDKIKPTKDKLNSQLEGLKRNFEGVFLLRNLSEHTLNVVVSFGERMSSVIVAAIVDQGKRYFTPDFIKTEKRYGKNVAETKITDALITSTFENIGDEEKAIVPGFISSDAATGEITNLGRGGSDYTGALIASAMDAEILEIWTDVDGFMTADPRIVKDAKVIDSLSFTESMELCTFGAKVVYPPTIYPVFHKNIPIKILNTFNPKAPGTLITDHLRDLKDEIKGVSMLKDICVLKFKISEKLKNSQLAQRAFNILSKNAVTIIPLSQHDPDSEFNLAVAASDADRARKLIITEFSSEIKNGTLKEPSVVENQAAVALVGQNMKSKGRLAARIGNSLLRINVDITAYSFAHSDSTVLYIINQEKSTPALLLIHSLIFN